MHIMLDATCALSDPFEKRSDQFLMVGEAYFYFRHFKHVCLTIAG
jgi:hypothetical protein